MSNTDRVLEYLQSIPAPGGCDDCLAKKTGIRPRRQVTEACRRLIDEGTLVRKKGKCPLGDHTRVLNTLTKRGASRRCGGSRRGGPRTAAHGRARTGTQASAALGIEEAWRYVDRFCRALWAKHLESQPPISLAESITTLRDEGFLPAHEANMMHTIRALRNLVVHENLVFGDHETAIARAAWEIVRAWAERREREAWRLTLKMCA